MKKLLLIITIFINSMVFSQTDLPSYFQYLENLEYISFVETPDYTELKPGQISKDGSKYYLPIIDTSKCGKIYLYNTKSSGSINLGKIITLPAIEGYIFSGQVSFSGNGKHFVFTTNLGGYWSGNSLHYGIISGNSTDSVVTRSMDEINSKKESESYGWLSSDALRLYYTFNDGIYVTRRKKVAHNFSTPKPMELEIDAEIISCWLTENECTIYLVTSGNEIYKATRKRKRKKFSKPELFTSELAKTRYIGSCSLSPNGEFLYVYSSGINDDRTRRILIFRVKNIIGN